MSQDVVVGGGGLEAAPQTVAGGNATNANGNGSSSGAISMFAALPTPTTETTNTSSTIDLDELFRDCYFGEFPVPPFAGQDVAGAAPLAQSTTPQTVAPSTTVQNPLQPNSASIATIPASIASEIKTDIQAHGTITSPLPVTAPAPVPITSPLPPTAPAAVALATPAVAVASQKRKADDSNVDTGPVPMPISSSQPSTTSMAATSAPQAASLMASAVSGDKKDSNGKALTDQQKVERRERNREHAKRSRLRKKFLLESLQEQIHGLQSEIETLKDIIKKELPDKAESLLKVLSGPREDFTPLPMPSGFGPVKTLMEPDYRLMSALSGSQQNFAISDPSLPDNPIVYVSQGFLDLTGYALDQVLGRNCRFLQGPGTDQSAVDVIRRGINEGVDTSVCLLNYKADGTPFWNQFFVAALRDAENNVVNFVGVQCEVSKAVVEKQIQERKMPVPPHGL